MILACCEMATDTDDTRLTDTESDAYTSFVTDRIVYASCYAIRFHIGDDGSDTNVSEYCKMSASQRE